ncbi:protein of unknown function (plasmid) [Cupriavidus taiwanensis]|uniref:Uncharacterized protein n=1 Tax=Cupriavidus taiwanensis TaxID=164546 RepID=A0A9Q7V217_9BURK|nr:protein of unknown function [Cupriavidus taiwanensis]
MFLAFLPLKSLSGYFLQRLAISCQPNARLALSARGTPSHARISAALYLKSQEKSKQINRA